MATADIQQVGPGEYGLLAELYSEIFRPPQDAAFFARRLDRREASSFVAELDGKPVGFACGYELRPSTYYSWLCGVVRDARRLGVATQLIVAAQAWAKGKGFDMLRFECQNQARPMIHVAIREGYDIVGIRWDNRSLRNLVIFEKNLREVE
jgi:GNAT superfamily N-acetyltransferase